MAKRYPSGDSNNEADMEEEQNTSARGARARDQAATSEGQCATTSRESRETPSLARGFETRETVPTTARYNTRSRRTQQMSERELTADEGGSPAREVAKHPRKKNADQSPQISVYSPTLYEITNQHRHLRKTGFHELESRNNAIRESDNSQRPVDQAARNTESSRKSSKPTQGLTRGESPPQRDAQLILQRVTVRPTAKNSTKGADNRRRSSEESTPRS